MICLIVMAIQDKINGGLMGYKSFRDVYHKLAIVIDNGYCFDTFNMMQEKIVPEGIQVNSALVYGYIDKMCGFSYKVLAASIIVGVGA